MSYYDEYSGKMRGALRAVKEANEQLPVLRQKMLDKDRLPELKDVLMCLDEVRDLHALMKEHTNTLYALVDWMNKIHVPETLGESGFDKPSVPELGKTFRVQDKYSARTVDKKLLQNWLVAENAGSLIQPTINSSSLGKYLHDLFIETGREPPAECAELVLYKTTVITKQQ